MILVCNLCASLATASEHVTTKRTLPVIPGASGFGSSTVAGSGRHLDVPRTRVFNVTNLNASGAGSLQDCIYATGPRTCVFEVSGTIDLTGDRSYGGNDYINLTNPYITIAGHTAPSPGITVRGKTLRIEAHDVLIQHLRFRVGDSPDVANPPEVRDALLIAGRNDRAYRTPYNIVIDHCSFSWGIDEVVSIKDSSHSVTLSNSIISEGLDRSLHPKGRHSKGLMAVGNYLSIKRNLIANVQDRAPLDISPNAEYVNNLTHNAKHATFGQLSRSRFYADQGLSRRTSIVANVRRAGSFTSNFGGEVWGVANHDLSQGSQFFLSDNQCADANKGLVACSVSNSFTQQTATALHAQSLVSAWPVSAVQNNVTANVGARPLDRDTVDRRIVHEVITSTGNIPDCVEAEPLYYPIGNIIKSGPSRVFINLKKCYAGRFEKQTIEVRTSKGAVEERAVLKHQCDKSGNNELIVNKPWSADLTASSPFRIKNSCVNNAGGWPVLANNHRALTLPNKLNQVGRSGYTKLEEYLHTFYSQVEAAVE